LSFLCVDYWDTLQAAGNGEALHLTKKIQESYIPLRFRDQVALVVGGAQGIGKAIAVRLAREGAHIVIGDIDRPMLARTAQELTREGNSVRTVVCDVRRPRQVERMVTQVIRWHKRIDILMYVAGVGKGVPFVKTDERL
jgi:NAD(P)-dependent dehydrogenase (short-subunit alcohol dehydrogenase family)